MNYLSKNIKFLRKQYAVNQSTLADAMNKGQSSIGNWENNVSEPNISEIQFLAQYFGVSESDLLGFDLQNVHLNKKDEEENKPPKVHLNVHPNVHLNAKKGPKEACRECEIKDIIIKGKEQLLQSNTKLIHSQEAQIQLLQNQLDQMKYELKERDRNQRPEQKERKTA